MPFITLVYKDVYFILSIGGSRLRGFGRLDTLVSFFAATFFATGFFAIGFFTAGFFAALFAGFFAAGFLTDTKLIISLLYFVHFFLRILIISKCFLMAWPTENLTVFRFIVFCITIFMMCFSAALPISSRVTLH